MTGPLKNDDDAMTVTTTTTTTARAAPALASSASSLDRKTAMSCCMLLLPPASLLPLHRQSCRRPVVTYLLPFLPLRRRVAQPRHAAWMRTAASSMRVAEYSGTRAAAQSGGARTYTESLLRKASQDGGLVKTNGRFVLLAGAWRYKPARREEDSRCSDCCPRSLSSWARTKHSDALSSEIIVQRGKRLPVQFKRQWNQEQQASLVRLHMGTCSGLLSLVS